VQKIEETLRSVEAIGVELNGYFYASLIIACSKFSPPDIHRIKTTLQEMATKGIDPSCVHGVLCRAVGRHRAQLLLHRSNSVGFCPKKDGSPRTQREQGSALNRDGVDGFDEPTGSTWDHESQKAAETSCSSENESGFDFHRPLQIASELRELQNCEWPNLLQNENGEPFGSFGGYRILSTHTFVV
jgi:hypothetical protein